MKMALYIVCLLLVLVTGDPCAPDDEELVLLLNKKLQCAAASQTSLPDPNVHIALRLSPVHNLATESKYLNQIKTNLHDNIESSLNRGELVIGRLALYILALRSSCHDLNTLSLTVNQNKERLLTQLKWQLEEEKANIALHHQPGSSYYQYSLAVIALCVCEVRVSPHVTQKLMHAVEFGLIDHGNASSIDSLAVTGLALQCLKDAKTPVWNATLLNRSLELVKQKLLGSERHDGHIGNRFSTGLAVQALRAQGAPLEECSGPMGALWAEARSGTYHSPASLSQSLPALQHTSYLQLRGKECRKEDDSLTEGAEPVPLATPTPNTVAVQVEVVTSVGVASSYTVDVPVGSSLLQTLTVLQNKQSDFTFQLEPSLAGPVLVVVNGEPTQNPTRRFWHLSSDGSALTEGVKDYKIETSQKITIKSTSY